MQKIRTRSATSNNMYSRVNATKIINASLETAGDKFQTETLFDSASVSRLCSNNDSGDVNAWDEDNFDFHPEERIENGDGASPDCTGGIDMELFLLDNVVPRNHDRSTT